MTAGASADTLPAMPVRTAPLPPERYLAAIEVLRRIYEGDAPHPLHDDGMTREWVDAEIAAFIRQFGPLPSAP